MSKSLRFSLLAIAVVISGTVSTANADLLQDWDASDWSGDPNDDWVSQEFGGFHTDAMSVGADIDGGTKNSGSVLGVTDDYITFDGSAFNGFTTLELNPLVGLNNFTISSIFRTTDAAVAPENDNGLGEGWRYNGITGFETGGGGQGEFQVGIYNGAASGGPDLVTDGLLGGAHGILADGAVSGGIVNDGIWHTQSYVYNGTAGTSKMYVDGVLINTVDNPTGGGMTGISDAAFGIGLLRLGERDAFFLGDIARVRFDDVAFSDADAAAAHAAQLDGTYTGVVAGVPGDANGDGSFDFGDIEAFFLAITDLPAYTAQFPNVAISLLDMNADGNTDFGDIEAFFAAVTGG